MTILKKFGEYIEESYQHKLSSDILHHARRALLDWHAALICGANSATAAMLISSYQDLKVHLCSFYILGIQTRVKIQQ